MSRIVESSRERPRDSEGEAIVEAILSRCVGVGEHGEPLKLDDGDAYIEALARSFDGDELYSAELVDSHDDLNGDDRPVEIADYSPELPRHVPGASAAPPDDRGSRFPSAS